MRRAPRNKNTLSSTMGSIRIIAGQWRGRKLKVLDSEGLRPTTDRVKETLFNWLAMDIRQSRCLDLFAGSGGLGFEALSRYAQHVTFIERDKQAAKVLSNNLALLNLGDANAQVHETDALTWLNGTATAPYDIVFIDPPFRHDLVSQACQGLEQNRWLAPNALVYVEHESEIQPQLPASWQVLKVKTAGQVTYSLYQVNSEQSE